MKKTDFSVYSTNKGGMIKAPKNVGASDPRATKTVGEGDLRAKKRG